MKNLTKEEREKLHQQEIQNKIKSEKIKKTTKKVIIYLVLILFIAAIFYFVNLNAKKPGKYDDFAKCLTEKNAIFYGSYQCSACATQKNLFGKSVKYVNYIECGALSGPQNKVCQDASIQAYPTWEFEDGVKETGVTSLESLSQKTGCLLPE